MGFSVQETTASKYTIRKAEKKDCVDLLFSVRQFCKEIPHPAWAKVDNDKVLQILNQLVESPICFAYLVECEAEVVGALLATKETILINNFTCAQELMFWIDKEHRVGTTAMKLVDEYTAWAKRVGCDFVRLSEIDSIMGSKISLLYKRKKFVPVETAYVRQV